MFPQSAQAWWPGKDGARTVAANTAYTALPEVRITTLTAAAVSGDSTITLASTAGITAGDVLLIIEVSYSSLKSDQQEKEELYAKAGIGEYWIVDITHELIHVHRNPAGGRYELIEQFGRDQCLAPQIQPHAVLVINDLLGKS